VKTRRILVLVSLGLACVGVSGVVAAQNASSLQIAAGYAAKETCSCVFVEGLADAACSTYGTAPTGVNPKMTIDHTGNTVTANLLGTTRTAAFTAGQGCVLQVP
jgi:hypothetical protein